MTRNPLRQWARGITPQIDTAELLRTIATAMEGELDDGMQEALQAHLQDLAEEQAERERVEREQTEREQAGHKPAERRLAEHKRTAQTPKPAPPPAPAAAQPGTTKPVDSGRGTKSDQPAEGVCDLDPITGIIKAQSGAIVRLGGKPETGAAYAGKRIKLEIERGGGTPAIRDYIRTHLDEPQVKRLMEALARAHPAVRDAANQLLGIQ
jgi:hypothetical protein